MADNNRHLLDAAEEKMARMSAELGRVRNELDRYSRELVEKERECDKLRKSVAKDETGVQYRYYNAGTLCRVFAERDAYKKALEDIYHQDCEDTCAADIGAISGRCIKALGYDKEEA